MGKEGPSGKPPRSSARERISKDLPPIPPCKRQPPMQIAHPQHLTLFASNNIPSACTSPELQPLGWNLVKAPPVLTETDGFCCLSEQWGPGPHTPWRKHHLPQPSARGCGAWQPMSTPTGESSPVPSPPSPEGSSSSRDTRAAVRIFRCSGPLLPPWPCLPAVASFLPALLKQMNKNKSLCGPRKALGERTAAEGKGGEEL